MGNKWAYTKNYSIIDFEGGTFEFEIYYKTIKIGNADTFDEANDIIAKHNNRIINI